MSNHATLRINKSAYGFEVLCEIRHPMESGERRNSAGTLIAADYITRIEFRRNQSVQAEMLLGKHVSANPVVGTRFQTLVKGDEVSLQWQDISGNNEVVSIKYDGRDG